MQGLIFNTVRDPKVSHFFQTKTLKKWDTLRTFTQNVPFLDYNKTKKEKSGTISGETLSGHGLYGTGLVWLNSSYVGNCPDHLNHFEA